ncbi:MAG TPA: response regulator [Solirubrobacteraceae bacterium]|jgi:two-component system KDP operon response regulator KdpE
MSEGSRVLVVDDEPQIVRGVRVVLRNAGFRVDTAGTVAEALDALAVRPPDVMVLDLVLPDGTGVDVLRELRRYSALPVLVLSALGDERQKIRALDEGADDYVTKPFAAGELSARLRALLRRAGEGTGDPVIEAGDVRIDLGLRRVTKAGHEVHLTPIEFDLVRVLSLHRGKLLTHRQLLTEVWGPAYERETQLLRVHVAHIRGKLEDDPASPRLLITEPGVGYRLVA